MTLKLVAGSRIDSASSTYLEIYCTLLAVCERIVYNVPEGALVGPFKKRRQTDTLDESDVTAH